MEMGKLEKRLELVHQADTAEQLGLIPADLPTPSVPIKSEGAASPPSSDLAPRPTLPDVQVESSGVGIMGGFGISNATPGTA